MNLSQQGQPWVCSHQFRLSAVGARVERLEEKTTGARRRGTIFQPGRSAERLPKVARRYLPTGLPGPDQTESLFFNPQDRHVNIQRGLSNPWFGSFPRLSVVAGGPTTASVIGRGALASSSWHAEQPSQ